MTNRHSIALLVITSVLLLAGPARAEDAGVYRVAPEARDALMRLHAPVDHARVEGDYLVELTAAQAERLRAEGFAPQLLYRSAAEMDRELRSRRDFTLFHTYDEIRAGLYTCAAAHPEITRLEVLGTSGEGREIVALKISDAPQIEEDEPTLVFWGGIHGNEYAGGEMPYLYALDLCESYGLDSDVTDRVNGNQIWCIPMINPDGRVHGVRTNHNGVDLNRDFGFQWNGEGASASPLSQVETQAVQAFCRSHAVALSLTFHCSGNIVFYPWGYWPHDVPDLSMVRELAIGYAAAASYAYGNSWEDYETHGELLDEAYGSRGGICYTVEISNTASILTQTYERNRAGMDWLCAQAGRGLHGTVLDAETGEPLEAVVWVSGNPIPSYTDPVSGSVFRVVPPGSYTVSIQANGHRPATVADLVVTAGEPATFQVELPRETGTTAFAVTAVDQKDPNHAYAQATDPSAALGPLDGLPCSLGAAGFIVLDLGAGNEIINQPGDDFTVTEAITALDPQPESYRVYAGDAYSQIRLIGSAVGTASFDLGTVSSTRYLKIVDQSGSSPSLPYAGMDLDGITVISDVASLTSPLEGAGALSLRITPNPVTSSAVLRFSLPRNENVRLEFFDADGRVIERLLEDAAFGAGPHEVQVNGAELGTGMVFYRLRAGAQVEAGKLIVVK